MKRHFARKTVCMAGHKHDSGAEARRCDVLHDDARKGRIEALQVAPRFLFSVNGAPLKMRNGATARYTADFAYKENGKSVAEDVKAKNGFVERDVPLRLALFAACYPEYELRIVQ